MDPLLRHSAAAGSARRFPFPLPRHRGRARRGRWNTGTCACVWLTRATGASGTVPQAPATTCDDRHRKGAARVTGASTGTVPQRRWPRRDGKKGTRRARGGQNQPVQAARPRRREAPAAVPRKGIRQPAAPGIPRKQGRTRSPTRGLNPTRRPGPSLARLGAQLDRRESQRAGGIKTSGPAAYKFCLIL